MFFDLLTIFMCDCYLNYFNLDFTLSFIVTLILSCLWRYSCSDLFAVFVLLSCLGKSLLDVETALK